MREKRSTLGRVGDSIELSEAAEIIWDRMTRVIKGDHRLDLGFWDRNASGIKKHI